MRYRTIQEMSKRTEELKALANIMLVVACIGIAMCCITPNKIVGLLGIVLVAVGFLGGISFDSMAEISASEHSTVEKKKQTSKQLDDMQGIQYSFLDFLKDNGCTLEEFIHIYDTMDLNINYVYDQYQLAAGDDTIQTRRQVQTLMDKGRGIA